MDRSLAYARRHPPRRPGPADLIVSLAWTHPPTHPAIAKLVTLAREVIGYRAAGAT